MEIFRRAFLVVWGLVLVCFSAAVIVFLLQGQVAAAFFAGLSACFTSGNGVWLLLGIALLLLALGVLTLFSAFHRKSTQQMIQVESAEGTMINVGLSAVENVVRRAACDVPGISDVRCRLKVLDSGLGVSLYLTIPQGVAVPATAAAAKAMVEEQMLAMTGIKPAELKVIVDNIVDK